jgi:hypothetical protein
MLLVLAERVDVSWESNYGPRGRGGVRHRGIRCAATYLAEHRASNSAADMQLPPPYVWISACASTVAYERYRGQRLRGRVGGRVLEGFIIKTVGLPLLRL